MKQIKNSRKLSGPNSVIGDTAQLKSHLSKDSIITVERRIATLMDNYFITITKNVNLPPPPPISFWYKRHWSNNGFFYDHISVSFTYAPSQMNIIKQSKEVHLKYLTNTINYSLTRSTFHNELKQSEVIPVNKKLPIYRRRFIDSRVYYRIYQKSLREWFINWLIN